MKFLLLCLRVLVPVLALVAPGNAADTQGARGLRDAAVLVIRHAEKPADGPGLSPEGEARAKALAAYFKNFAVDGKALRPESLFAAKDSEASQRPRLTLDPLAKALGLKIDAHFKEKLAEDLAHELQARPHGRCILIAWRHGGIANLLGTLGADPAALLPGGKWPDEVFDWVLILRFDHEGRLLPAEAKRISQKLTP